MNLYDQWIHAKEQERIAVKRRREIEDLLLRESVLPADFEGTESRTDGEYHIKIVGRVSRSVDTDLLQQLAAEAGLFEHLHSLFRWKAEINKGVWESAAPEITGPLAGAITARPGRPSFTIKKEESK
jgi:hypothetical protein